MSVKEIIGKLDRFVSIVKFVVEADEFNSSTKRVPVTIKNVWAKRVFKSSSEDFEERVFDINKRDYVIHYDEDIVNLNMQDLAIVDEDKMYYITGFDKDYRGRRMFVLLNCEYRG